MQNNPIVNKMPVGERKLFPRGDGPLVSILIPTRGRVKNLCESVDSLYSLAKNKNNLEFILKVDDDDLPTVEVANKLAVMVGAKKIQSPRGEGYRNMHEWVNTMVAVATGDWLFLWNDDAYMRTQDWDLILQGVNIYGWHGVMDVACLYIPTVGDEHSEQFMFLRRKVVELLGHYSLIPHNDTWVKTLMRMVNSMFYLPFIQVEHKIQIDDQVYKEGVAARETREFTVDDRSRYQMRKLQDAIKLQEHIDKCNGVA